MNEAAVEPPDTTRVAGTVTFGLLLASETVTPSAGATPDSVMRQGSDSDPVMEVLVQEIAPTVGADFASVPTPVRLTVTVPALVERDSSPAKAPALEGMNWTAKSIV